VTAPVSMRGWIDKMHLLAFARHDIETVPGSEWWLAEAPLRIRDGDAKFAMVACPGCRRDEGSRDGLVKIPCADLRGTLPAEVTRDECNGARGKTTSRPNGSGIHVLDDDLMMDLASGQKRRVDITTETYLLERQGARARVEQFDVPGWIRVHGWVDASRIEPYSQHVYAGGSSSAPGQFNYPSLPLAVRAKLQREVPMTASFSGGVATPLAADSLVDLIGRYDNQVFAIGWQANRQGVFTLATVGWIPADAVKEVAQFPRSLNGRLRRPARQLSPKWDEFQVTMKASLLEFEARPDAQGRFRVPAPLSGLATSPLARKNALAPSEPICGRHDNGNATYLFSKSRDGLWTGSTSVKDGKQNKPVVVDILPSDDVN